MSIIDIFIGFFTFGALRRGYKMGFAHELERLVKVGLSLIGSLGAFRYARQFLMDMLGMDSGLSGLIGFVGSFALIYWVIRTIRVKLRKIIDIKFGAKLKPAGAVLGATHALAASVAILAGITLVDWSPTNSLILKNSKVAAVAADLLGNKKPIKSATESVGDTLDKLKGTLKDRGTAVDPTD